MPEITKKTLVPKHYVGIRRQVPVADLPAYFSEVFPKVMGWLSSSGVEPASMPMAMWHAMDMDAGVADVQAGCFVGSALDGEGEITPGVTPATEALTVTHVGGYDTVGATWGSIYQHAASLSLRPGAGWEIYVDDPTTVEPARLRTEITLPVQP